MMKDLPNMLGTWIIFLFGAYVIFRNFSGDATIMLQGTMRNVLLWGIFLMLWSIQSKLYLNHEKTEESLDEDDERIATGKMKG
mgnify:CR=1 FL=1|tara:strand:+ start:254 stop:502 length:249 start_codon:yes stop_codon:yes gene_type:complete